MNTSRLDQTLLNLACSGKPRCGFAKGHYYFLVGDSVTGKTFLAMTCFAEASINSYFDEYEFCFDNAEDGALMDWGYYFGDAAAQRIVAPSYNTSGEPVYSRTIEDFYYHLDLRRKANKSTIYVLDSMDALTPEAELKKFAKQRQSKAKRMEGKEGKDEAGSYGTAKAKANSAGMAEAMPFLRDTGSILIIISQTRDRIGMGAKFDPKTRSGGKSLTFYAGLELWSSQAGKITKMVNEKKRVIGVYSKIRVKKNRLQGKDRTVTVPIYDSVGIDDIGGCIDYLVEEGHWKKIRGRINAKEFEYQGSREDLAEYIDENDLHRELQSVVGEVWKSIEKECEISRRSRYD